MRLKQLKNRRAGIRTKITTLRELLTTENRVMTAEEKTTLAAAATELTAVNEEIAQEEQFIADDDSAAAAAATPAGRVDPTVAAAAAAAAAAGTAPRGVGLNVIDRTADVDPMCGFRDIADFAGSVRAVNMQGQGAYLDPRLKAMWAGSGEAPVGPHAFQADAPTGFHQEAHTTEGYSIPPEIRNEVFSLVFAEGSMLDMVRPEPTGSNAVEIEADENTPWGATGVQARWRQEAEKMTASQLTTNRVIVRLHELYAFVLATEELLEDHPRLNNRLTQQSAAAIRFKASEAIVTGNGAGQPLGWFNAKYAGAVSVAKEGSQTADTIEAANVLKMLSVLLTDGADLGRIFWLANRNTLPQIAVMTIGDQPVWTPPNQGMKGAPTGLLLGHPIVFSEHAETLGDKGDIQLINAAGYYAAVKGGPSAGLKFATSIHLFFDFNIQAFRWIFRLAGQPFLSTPVVANKGDDKSFMVFLDERT